MPGAISTSTTAICASQVVVLVFVISPPHTLLSPLSPPPTCRSALPS
jgi:hypothetical protein